MNEWGRGVCTRWRSVQPLPLGVVESLLSVSDILDCLLGSGLVGLEVGVVDGG